MALCLAVAIHFSVRTVDTLPRANGQERWRSAVAAIPAFGLGIIVVVGIRIGIVTTTEAAALAALYTLFLVSVTGLVPNAYSQRFASPGPKLPPSVC